MFEPPELRDAQSFPARAERLFVRALNHALSADLTDWAGLGLGLEAAHKSLMLCPFESEEVWSKCVDVCERAIEASEAARSDDAEALRLGVKAAQLVTMLRAMSGHFAGPFQGVSARISNVGVEPDLDDDPYAGLGEVATSDLGLTSSEISSWLVEDQEPGGN